MTFEEITTFLNILAISGLTLVSLIAIHNKHQIIHAQEHLNQRLDHILQVIDALPKVRKKKTVDQKDPSVEASKPTNKRKTSSS